MFFDRGNERANPRRAARASRYHDRHRAILGHGEFVEHGDEATVSDRGRDEPAREAGEPESRMGRLKDEIAEVGVEHAVHAD